MAIFEIDGREIHLEGIEHDTVVIARPTHRLKWEEWKKFSASIHRLSEVFARHHCTLVTANFDDVTFEVLKAKEAANP